jgi:putative ABC transport system permease protein
VTPHFFTIFRWHVLRYTARHKLLGALNVLSVALGIAVYLAIQVANHSANESFAAGVDLVAGKAHLEVRGEIDETQWPEIAHTPGVKAATAIVEGVATLPDLPGEYLRLVGVDVLTSAPFSTFHHDERLARFDLDQWLARPGCIALTTEFAARHGLKTGSKLRALINATVHDLEVVALIDTRDSPAGAQPRFATIDLGWAQELFGTQGRLSSIQLLLDDPRRAPEIAEALRGRLPASLQVDPPRQRSFQMQTMLAAFRLNLTALSLVSLLVGAFLIYNTISASVARRRVELGILRALGTTRWEVRALFLGEAMVFGVAGIVLGSLGGVLLARVTVQAVERTISSLYLLLSIDRQFLSPWQFLSAAALGVAAVFAGAWFPADEAARVDPVSALSAGAHAERSETRRWRWRWIAGLSLVLAVVAGVLALRTGPAMLAFVAAFFTLAGFAALAPETTIRLGAFSSRFARLAADRLRRSVHRHAVTVAALATAIAMTVGLAAMIHSFRDTVDRWIGQSVVADLYVAPASNEVVGLAATVPSPVIEWLRQQPGVSSVDTFREVRASIGSQSALLAIVDGRNRRNLDFGTRDGEAIVQRVMKGDAVAVTESFERKFHLGTGDRVPLSTAHGVVEFPIAGVYRDYTRDQGAVFLTRELFARHWVDGGPNSLAVYLDPDADPAHLAEAFTAKFGAAGEFVVYSNRTLRQRILRIFDQTFAVTEVLRVIALAVALLGVALSATTLVAERQRETGILRAIGASAGQIRRLFMAEAALLGGIACVLGLPAGIALALVLTWVVNPAFFGWTIHFSLPWGALASTVLWIVPASALAAWWPARRAASANLSESIREE